MHVIEERWVGHDQVHGSRSQAGGRAVGASKVDFTPSQWALGGPLLCDLSGEGFRACAAGAVLAFDLGRRLAVLDGAEQPGAEKVAKGPGTLGDPPGICLNRGALGLQDMVREHVPYRSRALALVGCEEVVEFEDPGEQSEQGATSRRLRNIADGGLQPAERHEMTVIEKVAPIVEAVIHGLTRVMAMFQDRIGNHDGPVGKTFVKPASAIAVSVVIVACRGQILLVAIARQNEFPVESIIGPGISPRHRLENRKHRGAVRARRPCSMGRTLCGVEAMSAAPASNVVTPAHAGENIAALRTNQLNLGPAVRPCVARDGIRRKKVNRLLAMGTTRLHDPEVVKDVAGASFGVNGLIEVADSPADRLGQVLEGAPQATAIHRSQRGANGLNRDGIDIKAECRHAQLMCFADRGS